MLLAAKSSQRELERHEDDKVDVFCRNTGIKAGTMQVSDGPSHLLLSVSFFSSFHLPDSMRHFDRAALFIEACLKYGVMEANDSSNILFENPLLLHVTSMHLIVGSFTVKVNLDALQSTSSSISHFPISQ